MCTGNTRPSWNLAHVDWDENDPMENERTVRLPDVLRKTGPKLIDTYDPGDSWKHAIVLEKQLPVDPAAKYPVCTDGQLACPPENCGGIPGFYDLVEAIADPNHEQHKELKDWLGYDLEPIDFSIDCVNQMLFQLACAGSVIQLSATYFLAGTCPSGQPQTCTSPGSNPLALTLDSYACSPLYLHYTVTGSNCPALWSNGYTSFAVTE